MKINPIIFIIIGAVAIVGAILCAYLLFELGNAVSVINSVDPASVPAGTDVAGLQENAKTLGTIIIVGWLWVICVLACGGLVAKSGVDSLRKKK